MIDKNKNEQNTQYNEILLGSNPSTLIPEVSMLGSTLTFIGLWGISCSAK